MSLLEVDFFLDGRQVPLSGMARGLREATLEASE
jgi:hypothetical protein